MILFIQYLYLNLSGLQANNFVHVAYNIYIYLNVSSVKKELYPFIKDTVF